MEEIKYGEAAVEVLDILNYTNKKDIEKIPQSFIKFLTDISNKNCKVKFNHEQPIYSLNLSENAKELLGFIYITWWCNNSEYEKYKKLVYIKNIAKQNIKLNDMFETKKEYKIIQNESMKETSIIEYKKENILQKIFNKIRNFFN